MSLCLCQGAIIDARAIVVFVSVCLVLGVLLVSFCAAVYGLAYALPGIYDFVLFAIDRPGLAIWHSLIQTTDSGDIIIRLCSAPEVRGFAAVGMKSSRARGSLSVLKRSFSRVGCSWLAGIYL